MRWYTRILLWIKEHLNELLISVLFLTSVYFIWQKRGQIFSSEQFPHYFTALVGLFGIFLGWLQFIFYKYNKKKEAAITYFPKPLELEGLEGEIDATINFWTRKEPLDNYEVKLMLGQAIEEEEYKLIWKKLSTKSKNDIIRQARNLSEEKQDNNMDHNNISYCYKEKYAIFIDELYRQTRRKLNAYLNQIEGYCLAINKGNIDLQASKELFVHKFYHHFRKARPYIEAVRHEKNDKNLYIEFEKVLKKWGCI